MVAAVVVAAVVVVVVVVVAVAAAAVAMVAVVVFCFEAVVSTLCVLPRRRSAHSAPPVRDLAIRSVHDVPFHQEAVQGSHELL